MQTLTLLTFVNASDASGARPVASTMDVQSWIPQKELLL